MTGAAKPVNVLDLTPDELRAAIVAAAEPAYRAKQILEWVYQKGVYDFDKMTNLPQGLREKLKASFRVAVPPVAETQTAEGDASRKLLLKLSDKDYVETVYMAAKGRETACVSSQVGCKFHCAFCASGQSGFFRNLTQGEIISQVLRARDLSPEKRLTNIVYMGIGEPFDNYKEVVRSIRTLNSPEAMGLGARRITVSTCGVIPKIKMLAEEKLQVELSVSLHGATDTVRGAVMPVNQAFPVKELIAACREYVKKTKRAITFEYILIRGVNASPKDAEDLAKLLKGMLCKVNLIPYNPIEEFPHDQPPYADIVRFQNILESRGIRTTVRFSKGREIQAACGQLRSVKLKNG